MNLPFSPVVLLAMQKCIHGSLYIYNSITYSGGGGALVVSRRRERSLADTERSEEAFSPFYEPKRASLRGVVGERLFFLYQRFFFSPLLFIAL